MDTTPLLAELRDAMERLEDIYRRRDNNVRETNELMIAEHGILFQIKRINVDLVRGM